MMPSHNPVHIPAHLRGEADNETLDELVRAGRRMGHFWPLLAVNEPARPRPARDPKQGSPYQVNPRSAALLDSWLGLGD
ncbi:hypothetical protein [Streptacidiphilus albus]|uniref:hypothetical protein n=1 Tax=Streptacidiphilus albus TaxID=105425 RepID=UPI00054BA4C9|nr:hypothetical protein [Streptacidiphilus albus]